MELIDTHCHLFLDSPRQYDGGVDGAFERANVAGVKRLIIIGTDLEDSVKNQSFANKKDNIFAVVGIHPGNIPNTVQWSKNLAELERLAALEKVVAIGEVGLDNSPNYPVADEQIKWLHKVIAMAQNLRLPLVIHVRGAMEALLPILQKQSGKLNAVIHCFTADLPTAQKLIDWGYILSFTNMLTYPQNNNLRQVAAKIDLAHIMVETDAPFLPPQTRRGQICEPADVVSVAQKLAEIKNISLERVAVQTTKNAEAFFTLS